MKKLIGLCCLVATLVGLAFAPALIMAARDVIVKNSLTLSGPVTIDAPVTVDNQVRNPQTGLFEPWPGGSDGGYVDVRRVEGLQNILLDGVTSVTNGTWWGVDQWTNIVCEIRGIVATDIVTCYEDSVSTVVQANSAHLGSTTAITTNRSIRFDAPGFFKCRLTDISGGGTVSVGCWARP